MFFTIQFVLTIMTRSREKLVISQAMKENLQKNFATELQIYLKTAVGRVRLGDLALFSLAVLSEMER